MSENILVLIVGGIFVVFGVIEIFTGVATEKTGLVRRSEKPVLYWASVVIKIGLGLAIIYIDYLRQILGE